jgi:hypothetical protein
MARDIRQKFTWAAATSAAPYDGTANGDSNLIVTEHEQNLAVQIKGTFTATISIQARLHADFPFVQFASVSAAGVTLITWPAQAVKLVISGYSSGTVQAALAGFNVQQPG